MTFCKPKMYFLRKVQNVRHFIINDIFSEFYNRNDKMEYFSKYFIYQLHLPPSILLHFICYILP